MADAPEPLSVVADSLALAVVVSSDAPTLLLDGDLTVVTASASFSRAFAIAADALIGRSVFALGASGTCRSCTPCSASPWPTMRASTATRWTSAAPARATGAW